MSLLKSVKSLFTTKEVNPELLHSFRELLLMSDVSYNVTEFLVNKVQKSKNITEDLQVEIVKILQKAEAKFEVKTTPFVIFMYGVNGSGKTTTIAKLVNILQSQGKKVLVAACDTFRAAAAEQLSFELSKINCKVVVAENEKAQPSSVAFVASKKVVDDNYDVLIVDTAGRLHTNTNLMAELEKIHKTTIKNLPNAEFLNIAIMDATIGQNSIVQIQQFNSIIPISGVIITKMDTSAKGGAVISVIHEMQKKVYFICKGTGLADIIPFNAKAFAKEFLE